MARTSPIPVQVSKDKKEFGRFSLVQVIYIVVIVSSVVRINKWFFGTSPILAIVISLVWGLFLFALGFYRTPEGNNNSFPSGMRLDFFLYNLARHKIVHRYYYVRNYVFEGTRDRMELPKREYVRRKKNVR